MAKNRIRLIVYVLVLGFLNAFYQNYLFITMLVMGIILPIASLVVTKKIFDQIDVSIKFRKLKMSKNMEASIILEVENRSFFPVVNYSVRTIIMNTFSGESRILCINVPVGIKDVSEVEMKIESSECGRIELEIEEVSILDFLGIKIYSKKVDDDGAYIGNKSRISEKGRCNKHRKNNMVMEIMPEFIEIDSVDEEGVSKNFGESLSNTKGEDISEILDIRKYITGDRIQRVHWKITEKMDEIMVKEYPIINEEEIVIVPELNKENINLIMDVLYSVAHIMQAENLNYVIKWYDSSREEIQCISIDNEEMIDQTVSLIYDSGVYEGEKAYCRLKEMSEEKGIYYITNKDSTVMGTSITDVKKKVVLMWV